MPPITLADLPPALRAYHLTGAPQPLPGGTTQTFRVGDCVIKRISAASLENDGSPVLAAWLAGLTAQAPQTGFRAPMPLSTPHGDYITPEGWTAMRYLPGSRPTDADLPACIAAAQALHRAFSAAPRHPLLDASQTPWSRAHRACWGSLADGGFDALQPQLRPLVQDLYNLRRPIPTAPWQLIHGDLSPDNFLVAPDLPPAILDFSPFWGPPEFALAIFANFAGPRQRDLAPLRHFARIPHFNQLLLRAALRMLLVVAALNGLDGWDQAEEKWAAEQILRILQEEILA